METPTFGQSWTKNPRKVLMYAYTLRALREFYAQSWLKAERLQLFKWGAEQLLILNDRSAIPAH